MKTAQCTLQGIAPYSQSRHYEVESLSQELPKHKEIRTWRERCHADSDGNLFIPPMAFANNLKTAARYLQLQVPGKGKTLYTKHFEAGVLVLEGVPLPIKKDAVESEWVFVPSDGRPGSGARVDKCFPLIRSWSGKVTYYILDDIITEDVFRRVLDYAGNIIGIGRFRPENRGYYGRFKVTAMDWVVQ